MLYTASYFEPEHHHGVLLSISRSVPKGFRVDGALDFLAPNAQLLKDWKAKSIDEEAYCQRYRLQLKESWQQVSSWLKSLDAKTNQTLLCWEHQGAFCHRNLIALLVQKHRSDVFGGCDIRRVEIPKCTVCETQLTIGLDANFCSGCRIWQKNK
ncbi:DUF488 family protein, N3 subclade [Aliterella atlantica]|uniref:DUF488 domain-containing protein n=1 Tax=Aliterella atlantica CENA595 TaxID=1618023 RepID=A0A0D8ZRI2_9CYAN|nr:DUF488 family protein [Aliterella atlantica]KJH69801.1 hypothetical protein UH38_22080 [Aliterella atlantica CENA595]